MENEIINKIENKLDLSNENEKKGLYLVISDNHKIKLDILSGYLGVTKSNIVMELIDNKWNMHSKKLWDIKEKIFDKLMKAEFPPVESNDEDNDEIKA